MTTVYAKLTSKGQITLPISLRNAWDLKPGDQIAFDVEDGAKAVIAPKKRRSILENIEKYTIRSGRKFSNDELKEAVRGAVTEKLAQSGSKG